MKRYFASSLVLVILGLFALAVCVPSAEAQGYIRRYAANHRTFGAPAEISTTLPAAAGGAGGVVVYDKTFVTSGDVNVIYVTISATGDTHDGARSQFSALTSVPGVAPAPCNPGPNPVGGAPAGWVTLQRHKDYNLNYVITTLFGGDGSGGAGDQHDNSIHYTWCCPVVPAMTARNVKVKMASGNVDGGAVPRVFIEGVHFYIDGSKVDAPDACMVDTTPLPPGGTFP